MTYRIILSLIYTIVALTATAANAGTPSETLNYKVVYRWGIVNKQAGRATFRLYRQADGYSTAIMSARTEPWADKFYAVRDTLISTFSSSTLQPVTYRRIAHEGNRHANDLVTFRISGTTTTAHCVRLRKKDKETAFSKSETDLSASGLAVDMLSSFYYLRSFDFSDMKRGVAKTVNIFSGKRKEILTITYNGRTELKIDGKKYDTHKISFTFTSGEGKTTSKPIYAWLSVNKGHIPLKLEGELPIGKIQCIYTGSDI